MEKRVIKSGRQLKCIAKLEKYERISTEELKVVDGGALSGLLRINVQTQRKRECLIADTTDLIPLRYYCAEKLTTEQILTLLCATLQIAIECQRNGLAVDSLCWDMDHIFLERGTKRIKMLYWPVVRLEHSNREMVRFFTAFSTLMAQNGIDPAIEQRYRRFLYRQSNDLKLVEFQEYIHDLQRLWARQNQRKWTKKERAPEHGRVQSAWLEDRKRMRTYSLSGDGVVIGRDGKVCGLTLAQDKLISRRHARIFFQGGRYYLMDLGSKNGTSVNGRQIAARKAIPLSDGAELRMGENHLTFHVSGCTTRFINQR